jgi:hypothetical protein
VCVLLQDVSFPEDGVDLACSPQEIFRKRLDRAKLVLVILSKEDFAERTFS